MRVTVKTNVARLMASLDAVGRKQVPYAMARTLTALAYDARDKVRANLTDHFQIRSNWVAKGIQVVPARKEAWPMAEAVVGTRDQFMARQELGGKKEALSGTLGVPVAARKVLGNARGELKPGAWPSRVVGKKRPGGSKMFVATIRKGPNAGTEAVMRREGEGRYPLQVIYLLKPNVEVKPRWAFRATVNEVVQAGYQATLGRELAKAIATAKT